MTKKTVLCHFYNEEYLLPWFLNHHKKMFDHGIMIDYDSTDNSRKIIKEICPDWQIVNSRNKNFDAFEVDKEVIEIEKSVDGVKICLNVTEHLIGDYSILDHPNFRQIFLPCFIFVDHDVNVQPDHHRPLYDQKFWGYNDLSKPFRHSRSIHNFNFDYLKNFPAGRHFFTFTVPTRLVIFYWGFAPWNDHQIKRKLQIQNKISSSEFEKKQGLQHLTNRISLENGFSQLQQTLSKDLRSEIYPFINYHNNYIL